MTFFPFIFQRDYQFLFTKSQGSKDRNINSPKAKIAFLNQSCYCNSKMFLKRIMYYRKILDNQGSDEFIKEKKIQ